MDLHPFLRLVYKFVKKKSISTFQFTLISQFFDIVYKQFPISLTYTENQ